MAPGARGPALRRPARSRPPTGSWPGPARCCCAATGLRRCDSPRTCSIASPTTCRPGSCCARPARGRTPSASPRRRRDPAAQPAVALSGRRRRQANRHDHHQPGRARTLIDPAERPAERRVAHHHRVLAGADRNAAQRVVDRLHVRRLAVHLGLPAREVGVAQHQQAGSLGPRRAAPRARARSARSARSPREAAAVPSATPGTRRSVTAARSGSKPGLRDGVERRFLAVHQLLRGDHPGARQRAVQPVDTGVGARVDLDSPGASSGAYGVVRAGTAGRPRGQRCRAARASRRAAAGSAAHAASPRAARAGCRAGRGQRWATRARPRGARAGRSA